MSRVLHLKTWYDNTPRIYQTICHNWWVNQPLTGGTWSTRAVKHGPSAASEVGQIYVQKRFSCQIFIGAKTACGNVLM